MKDLKRTNVGIDPANSSMKVVTSDKELCYPNTMIAVDPDDTDTLIRRSSNAHHQGVFLFGKQNYIVGTSEGTGSGGRSQERYSSIEFKREVACGLAQIVTEANEQIYLICGTPATQAKMESVIEAIKKNLKGFYKVSHNGTEKTFSVVSVEVYSQPLGTLWSQLFNKRGIKKDIDRKHDFLILDIGWGTTDMQEINIKTGLNKPDTLENFAMSNYADAVLNGIEQQYPESYIRSTYEGYELDEEIRETDTLELPSGMFKIKKIKQEAQKYTAEQIYKRLLVKGYNFAQYGKILITGGGSIVLERALKEAFKDFANRIHLVEQPQLANAIGFYIMAKQKYKV